MPVIRRICLALSAGLVIALLMLGTACSSDKRKAKELPDQSPVPLKIQRYEKALFSIDPGHLVEGLDSLRDEYSFFLGEHYQSPENIGRLQSYIHDPLIQNLYRETSKQYADLSFLEEELGHAFGRFHHYFPSNRIPRVYTYISGLNYEATVGLIDSVMIIGLDMYLGEKTLFYEQLGIPEYKRFPLRKECISVDCMLQLANLVLTDNKREKNLLDWMIFQGKRMAFLDLVLPEKEDSLKIGYTARQLNWCREHEKEIWSFIISNNLLYKNDLQEIRKFIDDAPFTKGFTKESPGRIGWWMGWQIVKAYSASHKDQELADLMKMEDSQKLLNLSAYKPER